MLFGKLESEYVDGLLCDVTEKAINEWWIDIGAEYYNIEPHDGILGPTTVAALLGMAMGARNRLSAWGANIGKDVFDVEATKRAIAYFQRSQRITKTRRLERQTLGRLHKLTAREASGEKFSGARALKSTVAELGGKGGEMVMDFVGAREKAGVADVETVDYDQFIQLVKGERAKWLWYGKARKAAPDDIFSKPLGERGEGLVFDRNDEGGYSWTGRRKDSEWEATHLPKNRDALRVKSEQEIDSSKEDISEVDWAKEKPGKRNTLKRNDTRTGLKGLKDRVNLRGTHHKPYKDESFGTTLSPIKSNDDRRSIRRMRSAPDSPTKLYNGDSSHGRSDIYATNQSLSPNGDVGSTDNILSKVLTETPQHSTSSFFPQPRSVSENNKAPLSPAFQTREGTASGPHTTSSSVAGSTYHGVDMEELFPDEEDMEATVGILLRRTQSLSRFHDRTRPSRNGRWWPRQLSFSIAEDSLLTWDTTMWDVQSDQVKSTDPKNELTKALLAAEDSKRIRAAMADLNMNLSKGVDEKITSIHNLNEQAERHQHELDNMYYARMDQYHELREASNEVLAQERARLLEAIKDLEVLGARLEYEINALRGKVDDVEGGVAEFERQVLFIEGRVDELGDEMSGKEGWVHWAMRMLMGIGEKPEKEDAD